MPQSSTHILLVEDDYLLATLQTSLLEKEGYQITHLANGEEAVRFCASNLKSIDLILMDIDLGTGIEGTEAARQILAKYDVPLLFQSSHTEKEIVEKTELITNYGYVVKNSGITVLDASIKMALKLYKTKLELHNYRDALEKSNAFNLSIFDSLAEHIAVLDQEGIIIAVNAAWKRFAFENGVGPEDFNFIGRNYLTTSKNNLHISNEEELAQANQGILNVMLGVDTDFQLEYPCHSPNENRWFLMRVSKRIGSEKGVVISHKNITERKLAHEELLAANARLDLAQDVAKIGSWETDLESLAVIWSSETYKIFEVDKINFGSSHPSFLEFVHPEDRFGVDAALLESFKTENLNYIQHRIITKTGTVKFVEERWKILRDTTGKPFRAFGTCQDITERKASEEKYRRITMLYSAISQCNQAILHSTYEEELFRKICRLAVETGGMSMSWIGMIDEKTQTIQVVASHAGPEGFLDKVIISLNTTEVIANSPSAIAIHRDEPYWCQNFLTDPLTSSWREQALQSKWLSAASIPLKRNGKIIGVFSVVSNVLNNFDEEIKNLFLEMVLEINFALDHFERDKYRKATEIALLEKELKFQSIIEHIQDSLIIIDKKGIIQLFNQATSKIFGYEPSELIGKNVNILMPEPFKMAHDSYLKNYLKTGEKKIIGIGREVTAKRKNGEIFPVELTVSEWTIDGEPYFTGMIKDITVSKAVTERLKQTQKLESLGQISGGIAHDFNNILAILMGNLELIARKIPAENELLRKKIDASLKAVDRGSHLTRKLLSIARKQIYTPDRFDINLVIKEIAEMLERVIGKEIKLEIDLVDSELWILADRNEFETVIINLAINARDAMAEHGVLTIQSRTADHVHFQDDDTFSGESKVFAELSVKDSGSGIPKEIQSRIFEPFFTTKAKEKGTGLGLSLTYGFVKQSQGHINVFSEKGKGTSIVLYFPLTDKVSSELSEIQKDFSEQKKYDPKGKQILIVDDELQMLTIAHSILSDLGYHVITKFNAEEAVNFLKNNHVDMVITDIIMRGNMNGISLAKYIREHFPNIKILLTSGFPGHLQDSEVESLQKFSFLEKPYRMKELEKITQELLID